MKTTPTDRTRDEIAAAAARLIAETGLDYTSAKHKAARDILGNARFNHECLPDNDAVEAALREYQRIFHADTQPARVAHMRRTALELMHLMPQHALYLVGAAASGTAGEHSDLYLQCYAESSKDLHIDLLNAGIDADADEVSNPFGRGRVERVVFWFRGETVNITCYPPNKARQIGDQLPERLDRPALEARLAADDPDQDADAAAG